MIKCNYCLYQSRIINIELCKSCVNYSNFEDILSFRWLHTYDENGNGIKKLQFKSWKWNDVPHVYEIQDCTCCLSNTDQAACDTCDRHQSNFQMRVYCVEKECRAQ